MEQRLSEGSAEDDVVLGLDEVVDADRPAAVPAAFAMGSGVRDLDAMLAAYLLDIEVSAPLLAPGAGCVLLVEHDPTARRVMTGMLEAAGHWVLTASNAPVAMSIFDLHPVDVVLVDTDLADAPWIALRDAIRSARPGTPVLVIPTDPELRGLVLLAAISDAVRSTVR